MNIFVVLTIALAVIVILLRIKFPIGSAMLVAGFLIWGLRNPNPELLITAASETLQLRRTYDVVFALYFVMCLEIELRTSGVLSGMVEGLTTIFKNAKVILTTMPAFLGLLPSLGGARFSAPIVGEAAKNMDLSPEHKSAINFWFRHIFEFSNPIAPGVIMTCAITGIPYARFLEKMWPLTILAIIIGYFSLIRHIKNSNSQQNNDGHTHLTDISWALSSVVINFLLIVTLNIGAATAMGIVIIIMFIALKLAKRKVILRQVIFDALDIKMLGNVLAIMYFIQILTRTNVLTEIVSAFQSSPLPMPVIIASISFIIGVLTGLAQGHAAIVMPIVATMGSNLNLLSVAMVFGVAGQMLTPTHMCLIVTIDYFKANLFQSLRPILISEIILTLIFTTYAFLTW